LSHPDAAHRRIRILIADQGNSFDLLSGNKRTRLFCRIYLTNGWKLGQVYTKISGKSLRYEAGKAQKWGLLARDSEAGKGCPKLVLVSLEWLAQLSLTRLVDVDLNCKPYALFRGIYDPFSLPAELYRVLPPRIVC
jgi:hypothetical protein